MIEKINLYSIIIYKYQEIIYINFKYILYLFMDFLKYIKS